MRVVFNAPSTFVCALVSLLWKCDAKIVRPSQSCQGNFDVRNEYGVQVESMQHSRIQLSLDSKRFSFGHRIDFDVKTNHTSGVLMYSVGGSPHEEVVVLTLIDNWLFYIMKCPDVHATQLIPNSNHIADGRWHSVTYARDGNTGFLSIDGKHHTFYYRGSCGGFKEISLGGVDPKHIEVASIVIGHLKACFRNVQLSSDLSPSAEYFLVSSCE